MTKRRLFITILECYKTVHPSQPILSWMHPVYTILTIHTLGFIHNICATQKSGSNKTIMLIKGVSF